MVARCSRDSWDDAGGVAAQAHAIGERAVALAQHRRHAPGRRRSRRCATPRADEASDARRDFELEQKLESAAAVPLEIASLGADVAALAALAGEHGDGDVPRGRGSGRRSRRGRRPRRRAPRPGQSRRPRRTTRDSRERSRASRPRATAAERCSGRSVSKRR